MFLRTISPFYAPSRQSVIFPIHAFRLNTTEIYLHLTHQSEQQALKLMEDLCAGLPR
jgi:hypothetical protein